VTLRDVMEHLHTLATVGVAAALGISLPGCGGFSKLDPGAAVHVSGRVLAPDGTPAKGARVLLFKESDIGEVAVGLTFAIGSLGVVCLTPLAPSVCADARKVTTGSDGAYSFDLHGGDTQGSIANASTFDLAALVPAVAGGGNVVSTVRFEIQRAELTVPDLRVWAAPPDVSTATPEPSVRWPALPGDGYGASPQYTVRWLDGAGQHAVWAVGNATSGVHADARVLEDRSGTVEVDADTSMPGPDTDFRFTYSSQPVAFRGPAGAPPSRGSPCYAYGGDGKPVALSPCRLTDGDLFSAGGLQTGTCSGCTAPAHSAAYIDLGRVRPVSLVTVRGGASFMLVEGSNDGQSWVQIGNGSGALFAVTPRAGNQARYVRVRSSAGLDLSGLTEVSVWS
jgi:hypothetical protein